MRLINYRIAIRISLVVGTILVLMLALVAVEIRALNGVSDSLNDIVGNKQKQLLLAQELRCLARHNAVLVRNILLVHDSEAKVSELELFEQGKSKYDDNLLQLKALECSAQGRQILEVATEEGEKTFGHWRRIITADYDSDLGRMEILASAVRNHQRDWLERLDTLVNLQKYYTAQSADLALRSNEKTKITMAMINVLAIGAGIYMVVAITGSIVGPLRDIVRKVDRIAGGDFSTRIKSNRRDEIGELGMHINRMVEKLCVNEEELEEYRYNLEELIELRTGEINEQRERFISVLIHDLKGPLVPIIGFSRLLKNKKNLKVEKVVEYADAIHDSSSKLSMTIEQISKNLREKRLIYSFDKEPFDIEDLLCSVVKNSQPKLEADDIKMWLNEQSIDGYLSSGKILFAGDISKIRSLMENLIGNAVKYAENRIDINLVCQADSIEFIVDDDGVGVDKVHQKKIFEEYYQAPGCKEGTGVGLYSVKRIVDHYQGDINVTTSPASGARFIVSLPNPELTGIS